MSAGRRWNAALAAMLVMSGVGLPLPVATASTKVAETSQATSTPPTWRLAALPDSKPTSTLRDVTAVDATHAWAVGSEGYSPAEQYTSGTPVILEWNGSQWSRSKLPTWPWNGSLRLVAAGSATDVWALGGPMSRGINDNVTAILRYDGTSWREMPFPAGATPSNLSITDLAVVDGQAWLVGYRSSVAVILQWTGQVWQEHAPPRECVNGGPSFGGMPNFCNMVAIKAFAPNDIWAAGNGAWTGFLGPLLYHWNGAAWRTVQVGVNQKMLALQAIDGSSSADIWAVGDTLRQGGEPLAVHGNGTTWEVVSGVPRKLLPGVAVGADATPWLIQNLPSPSATLSTYKSGVWAETPAPIPPGTLGVTLQSIAAVPGTTRMLAVGTADLNTNPRLLQAVLLEYS